MTDTHDTWNMTHDTLHMTHDRYTLHMTDTHDTFLLQELCVPPDLVPLVSVSELCRGEGGETQMVGSVLDCIVL